MKTKITKESRNLLIAMLIGDGTISNNYVFKLSHCIQQKEYLKWKIEQLNKCGIRNNGLKSYISVKGYNVGKEVVYSQLNIIPFIKLLRHLLYKPYKKIANRQLLNRLDARGIAIWYMDDGAISFKKSNGNTHGFYIRISTCVSKEHLQIIINYFKEVWDISFYSISEGRNTYSLCCGTREGIKFLKIVEPYVSQIPEMHYKIKYDLSTRFNKNLGVDFVYNNFETQNIASSSNEDIV